MEAHKHSCFGSRPIHVSSLRPCRFRREFLPGNHGFRKPNQHHIEFSVRCCRNSTASSDQSRPVTRRKRRDVLLTPFLAIGASFLHSAAVAAIAEEEKVPAPATETPAPAPTAVKVKEEKKDEVIASRIYDATAMGEPRAIGKDKEKVWEKLMNARVVYLGEAEHVPISDDKVLELEIVKILRKRCTEAERPISLVLEAFPSDLQEQLDQFMDGRIDSATLKSYASHWPPQRWQEYNPLLSYCRDNGVHLLACGTPLKVLRIVQAEGIRGLSKADRKTYVPPTGAGFISGYTYVPHRPSIDLSTTNHAVPFGPSSFLSAQARVVEDYTMSQIILKALADGGPTGLLLVVTGASHVTYGTRGTGLPARISKKMQKKNQVVILLDPERQYIRREGEVPTADFLWYSAARPCNRNCFDRAEIARVMNAAGRQRDALPQDIQKGLDLGLISPEVLQNFFDLEQYPLISELMSRFQGFRERLLADPKFLHRLAIEESISITTTLLAQYGRRKENFFEELDYVITDTIRGIIVDFFTVWLPAPTLSFLSYVDSVDAPDSMGALKGVLGSIPDNAFQKNLAGNNWNLSQRIASVLVGGTKLAAVGFISSIGAVTSSNILYAVRKLLNPAVFSKQRNKRSPIFKTASIYAFFLGTSANLRYQIIAGIVEHRVSDQFPSQTLLVNMLSFVARTINSYWGTQQWIDLARYSGLQTQKTVALPPLSNPDTPGKVAVGCNSLDDVNTDEVKNE